MVAPFLNLRFFPDISSATQRRLGKRLIKKHLIAFGVWHFAYHRQPNIIFRKTASAAAEVRIHLAQIVAGAAECKSTMRRDRDCANDFVPGSEAVKPYGAFDVYWLHEKPSAGGIALFLKKSKPPNGHVGRIGIRCLFSFDHIRILDVSHLQS